MYCKYCACALGQNDIRKCPNCGANINLLDGGQTFFEDADLQAWRERPAEAAMPKTELHVDNNFAKPSSAKVKNASGKSHSNHVFVVKTCVVAITVIVAIALIALCVFLVGNKFGNVDETPVSDDFTNNAEKDVLDEIYSLPYIVDEYTNKTQGKDGAEASDSNEAVDDNRVLYLYNQNIDGNGKIDYSVNEQEHRVVGVVGSDGVCYISINGLINFLGITEDEFKEIPSEDKKSLTYYFNDTGFTLHFTSSSMKDLDNSKNHDPRNIAQYYKYTDYGFHCFEADFLLKKFGYEVVGSPEKDGENDRYKIEIKKHSVESDDKETDESSKPSLSTAS